MTVQATKTEENQNRKCHWCPKDAERMDYREVDGTVSKIVTCDDCYEISTEDLIKLKYGKLG
jgi:flavoprotein